MGGTASLSLLIALVLVLLAGWLLYANFVVWFLFEKGHLLKVPANAPLILSSEDPKLIRVLRANGSPSLPVVIKSQDKLREFSSLINKDAGLDWRNLVEEPVSPTLELYVTFSDHVYGKETLVFERVGEMERLHAQATVTSAEIDRYCGLFEVRGCGDLLTRDRYGHQHPNQTR